MALKIVYAFALWAALGAAWVLALGVFSAPGVEAAIERGVWPLVILVALGAPAFGAVWFADWLVSHSRARKSAETRP